VTLLSEQLQGDVQVRKCGNLRHVFRTLYVVVPSVRVVNEKEWECQAPKKNPLFRNFFSFLSGNGAFWCILGACFNVSIRHVQVKVEKQFCVPVGKLSHMADVSSMI